MWIYDRSNTKKIITVLCLFLFLLTGHTLVPCQQEKELFNEQAEFLNRKIDYLETCLSTEQPRTGLSHLYPYNHFQFNEEENKILKEAKFDKTRQRLLQQGYEIEKDADKLNQAIPMVSALGIMSDEEYETMNTVFKELKEKYKDFDYEGAKIELYK